MGGWHGGGFFGGMFAPRPTVIINAPQYHGGGGGGGNMPDDPNDANGSGPKGCALALIAIVAIFLVFALLEGISGNGGISASSVEREKLPASAVIETGFYDDTDGTWITEPRVLEAGMRTFFEETGVWPYLYILPNGTTRSTQELSALAQRLYPELFADEGHFLLVFCDDGSGSFNCGYAGGSQTKTVMDGEAVQILADYLDRHYNDRSLSESELFARAFADTGERIMEITPSPLVPIAICIAIVIVALIAYTVIKRRQEHERAERERTERILNTPLEKLSESDAENLADRYESSDTAAKTPKKHGDQDVESLAEKYEDTASAE